VLKAFSANTLVSIEGSRESINPWSKHGGRLEGTSAFYLLYFSLAYYTQTTTLPKACIKAKAG
jgi:hypothetical protein